MNNKNLFSLISFFISFLIIINIFNSENLTYKSGSFTKLLFDRRHKSMDVFEFYIDTNKYILENKYNNAFKYKSFCLNIKKGNVVKLTLNNGLINQIEFKGVNYVDLIKINNIKFRDKILSFIVAFFFLFTGFYLLFKKNINQDLTGFKKIKKQKNR